MNVLERLQRNPPSIRFEYNLGPSDLGRIGAVNNHIVKIVLADEVWVVGQMKRNPIELMIRSNVNLSFCVPCDSAVTLGQEPARNREGFRDEFDLSELKFTQLTPNEFPDQTHRGPCLADLKSSFNLL